MSKRWNEHYEAIGGVDVAVGDLVAYSGYKYGVHVFDPGRISSFTKTQIRVEGVDKDDLETPTDKRFNLTKDKGRGGGGYRVGEKYFKYVPMTEDEAREKLAVARAAAEKKREKDARRHDEWRRKLAERIERMRPGYDARTAVDEELGVFSMRITNDSGRPALVVWKDDPWERTDWGAKEPGPDGKWPTVEAHRIHVTYWYTDDKGDARSGSTTLTDGHSELEVLARTGYD